LRNELALKEGMIVMKTVHHNIALIIIIAALLAFPVVAESETDGIPAFLDGADDIDLSVYPGEEWKSDYNDYAGYVIREETAAYSDKEMTVQIGTVPAYTAVKVDCTYTLLTGYEPSEFAICCVVDYFDAPCYISTTFLMDNDAEDDYEYKALPQGATVYQRPDTESRATILTKQTNIEMIKEHQGWVLIRELESDYNLYAFVPKADANFIEPDEGEWDEVWNEAVSQVDGMDEDEVFERMLQDGWTREPEN